jgi:hypothetical protein
VLHAAAFKVTNTPAACQPERKLRNVCLRNALVESGITRMIAEELGQKKGG